MKPFEDNGLRSLSKRLLKSAEGIVLELGVGTGANLPYYQSKKIEKLILTDLTKRSVVLDKSCHRSGATGNCCPPCPDCQLPCGKRSGGPRCP